MNFGGAEYVGGRRRVVRHRKVHALKGMGVPHQLRDWHDFLAQFRQSHPHLSYAEAMKQARVPYKHWKAQHGFGAAHNIAGRRSTASSRRTITGMRHAYGSAHMIAGEEGGARRHRSVSHRRGRGPLGAIANTVGSVLSSIGLGRKRRVVHRKKSTASKRRGRGPLSTVANTAGTILSVLGLGRKRRVHKKKSTASKRRGGINVRRRVG